MRRDVRWDQMDGVEIERGLCGKRDGKMAVMERVESTTEEADTAGAGHSLVEDTRLTIGDCRLRIKNFAGLDEADGITQSRIAQPCRR